MPAFGPNTLEEQLNVAPLACSDVCARKYVLETCVLSPVRALASSHPPGRSKPLVRKGFSCTCCVMRRFPQEAPFWIWLMVHSRRVHVFQVGT